MNWKIALTKGKKNQKNEGQIEKNKTTKNLIEWWNWNTKKTLTKGSRKKIKIKRTRTEMEKKTCLYGDDYIKNKKE